MATYYKGVNANVEILDTDPEIIYNAASRPTSTTPAIGNNNIFVELNVGKINFLYRNLQLR